MIDFNQVEPAVSLTAEYLLSKVDEIQIFRYYFGHFELGQVYPSKFRRDTNPSTGFFIHPKTGAILYNDLRTSEKLNCIQFVQKLHGLSYKDTLTRIASDFGIIKGSGKPLAQSILNQTIEFDREAKRNTLIQIVPGSWTNERLKYWAEYYITKDELKREEVYPVDKLFINKREFKDLDHLCFAYVVREGDSIFIKIYQPFSKNKAKWISNVPITVPFGLDKLKYGTEHLIAGKAQKDRIVLLKFFDSVIGTQNESEAALPTKLVRHLCFHFPRRTIIWDADETGVENCTKFNVRGFGYFNTPSEFLPYNIKDVSDYVKAFGLKALEKLLISKNIL